MAINTSQQDYECFCVFYLCMYTHINYENVYSDVLGDFSLMFFSLIVAWVSERKLGEKQLKVKPLTFLAKTLALVFSRCTLLRKGPVARVMWLLVFCPYKQAVHNL